ncbi:MAG: hypothetical protein ACT443_08330 [Gemmatimonadota bacterium]
MRAIRAIGALLMLAACREGPAPFSVERPAAGDSSGQLTVKLKSDHTPVWNPASDSIFYSAPTFPGLPSAKGMLLGLPRTGGVATPILSAVQTGFTRQPWLAAPVLSTDGGNVAFFELTQVRDNDFDQVVCPTPPMQPAQDTAGTHSMLKQAVLRVRPVNSTSASDAARLTVRFAGRTGDDTGSIQNVAHPFHRMFEVDGVPIFRASWSPDGTKLAYSDGSNIRVWTVGQAEAVTLPGTADGVMPAWSPDGSLIAFSKPFRGGTQRFTCFGMMNNQVRPAAIFDRTVYTPYTRENSELMVVRPDGSGRRALGEGDSPTWTADSRTISAHRAGSLYRIAVADGAATLLPNTHDAFEPRISPDGRFLAFARRIEIGTEADPKGNYDIWVVPF